MKRLTQLLRENQIGEWCKRAAWLVAGFGVFQIVLFFWVRYGDSTIQTTPIFGSVYGLASTLQTLVGIVTNTIFPFFLLYAAGGLANHFLGTAEDDRLEEDEEEAQS